MEKEIKITIKDDIYDKFCLALNLSKEEETKAVETCFKWYIAKAFGKVSREYEKEVDENSATSPKAKGNFYGKAAKRIPLWAKHPEQYCHKIIRGFFLLQEQIPNAFIDNHIYLMYLHNDSDTLKYKHYFHQSYKLICLYH